ncbi:MAG: nitrite reductase small subunit NirD [Planctomycetota bacterium]|nr:nitrite reductase small subunit NirD [Planctomycetota bacterium]
MGKRKGESRGLAYLQRVRPEAVEHLLKFFRESARHLDSKTRFLISVVTKVISHSSRGIEQYVRRALEEGASPDEVIDAVLCAYPCAGLTRVVDAIDVILDMKLPGFDEASLRRDAPAGESAGDGGPEGPATSEAPDAAEEPESVPEASAKLSRVVLDAASSGWYEVGPLSDLGPAGRLRVLAGEHDVAIFRVDGQIFALGNRCPHTGGPLSEGFVADELVTCPLHAWRFKLRSGMSPDFPGVSVPCYEVKVEGGRVFLHF